MNIKQESMENLTQILCDSLEEEPEMWSIEPCTLQHKGGRFSNTTFWINDRFAVWNGKNTEEVFTGNQKARLLKSLKVAKDKVCSVTQQRLIDSLEDTRESSGYFSRDNFCKDLSEVLKKHGVKGIEMFEGGFFKDQRCELKTSTETIVLNKRQFEGLM